MATIGFYLDVPYSRDADRDEIKLYKKEGKPLKKFYNDKETSIYLIVNVRNYLIKVKTHERILAVSWDFEYKKAKASYPGSFELNLKLDDLKNLVLKNIRIKEIECPGVPMEEIIDIVKSTVNNTLPEIDRKDFFPCFKKFLEEKKKNSKPLTIKKYKTLERVLLAFEIWNERKLTFQRIDKNFDLQFKNYLIGEKGYLNNTVNKYYGSLKSYLTWALHKELHSNIAFQSFIAKAEVPDIVYVTEEELNKIYTMNLSHRPALAQTRDIFCFLCFTGQRISDAKNLKPSDIRESGERSAWHLFQIKGNKSAKVTVPLSQRAIEILERYKTLSFSKEKALPIISEAKTNENIKVICKLAGLTEIITMVKYSGKKRVEISKPKHDWITCHTGRRTFVTLSLEKKMRTEVVRAITGHSSNQTMYRYQKIIDKVVGNEFHEAWD